MQVRRPLAGALVALSVAAAACGTQVDPSVRQRAAEALLTGGGGGGLGGAGDVGTTTTTTGTSGDTAAAGGATGATGSSGGATTGGAATTGGSGGATAAAGKSGSGAGGAGGGCAGTSKDVGLSPTTLTVGTIASLTGPVPGLFEAAVEGTQAWAASVNATGGLCGRQVKVQAADDGTDCGQNQSDTEQLIGSVFAFVGSFSLYDDCGAKVLQQHPDVPDVHLPLGQAAGQIANNVAPTPHPPGYATGMFAYYAAKLGDKVKHVGTIYPNIPSAAASQQWFMQAAESQGWQFVYQRAAAATETDWTSDFVKMCQQKHVQVLFIGAENAQNSAKMVQDEQKAGCPKLVNIIPVAYDQAFLPDLGDPSLAEGLLGFSTYTLFFNADEAQRIPELGRFQQWFKRVYPDKPLNLYAMYSWADGLLFSQGVKAAGPNATRPSVMAALHAIHRFDANGMIAPADPNSKTTGASCYILWQVHNGQFERVDTPATGFRCDGTFMRYHG